MNSTQSKLASEPNGDFAIWLNQVKSHFAHTSTYNEAENAYSFATAYENGQTPKQAVDDFQSWYNAQ